MSLNERDLRFTFDGAVEEIIFDQMDINQPNYHGLSSMSRVDFIVEYEAYIIFIEVKDPSNPNARPEAIRRFLSDIRDGTLGIKFCRKFSDSFFYRFAEERLGKRLYYLSLVTLDPALLLVLGDQINRDLPPRGRAVDRWSRSVIEHCQIFNIETWNLSFPKWYVERLASAPQGEVT